MFMEIGQSYAAQGGEVFSNRVKWLDYNIPDRACFCFTAHNLRDEPFVEDGAAGYYLNLKHQ
jgi:hypothetical protein